MNLSITSNEFQLLRDLIEKECGIELRSDKAYLIETRLAKLVIESGCDTFGEFYLKAKASDDANLKTKIVDAITTNETLWFRDEAPFRVLRDTVLPELYAKIKQGQKKGVRVWSAACSTGQEPYSVAMILSELVAQGKIHPADKARFSILATDISTSALRLAKSATYDPISMSRGMLPGFKEKYFEEQERVCVLRDEIKEMVTFQTFNLQNSLASLGKFDIVMLRNVTIYFAHDFKVQLFQKIADVLSPDGYLVLGSSEILSGYSDDFVQRDFGRLHFYQLKP